MEKQMTPTKHPLSWFIERIGKTVVMNNRYDTEGDKDVTIRDKDDATHIYDWKQSLGNCYRDPHPLTSSILTCSVISCDTCGKLGTTEDLDKEVAAKGFDEYGWKLLMDGTINCGCE